MFVGVPHPKPMHGFSPNFQDMKMSRFGTVSDNTCCHGNALNTFSLKILNLERGTIKPMLPQLDIFTKCVYDCEHMSVKNYGTHFYKQHGRHSRFAQKSMICSKI